MKITQPYPRLGKQVLFQSNLLGFIFQTKFGQNSIFVFYIKSYYSFHELCWIGKIIFCKGKQLTTPFSRSPSITKEACFL